MSDSDHASFLCRKGNHTSCSGSKKFKQDLVPCLCRCHRKRTKTEAPDLARLLDGLHQLLTEFDLELPADYAQLSPTERRIVRAQYVRAQGGLCWYCNSKLTDKPPKRIINMRIDWGMFPHNFLSHPIHLQHDHETGLTEGAVHAYCNAVLWQYEGK